MAEWKPASVADSKMMTQCSNPGAAPPPAAYTFGHGYGPTKHKGTANEDLEAAKWYEGCHKSTTNEARNSDVQDFWQSCKGNAAGAIKDLTGRETAKQVKEAGRGSHVTLGCEGGEFTRSSRYQAEFCAQHKEGGGEAIKQVTANMYFQAHKNAKANKVLGTGSSLNLSTIY
uniref:Uncharacterized protein n=1 Tax=Tetradesmus obliquus TaxID=3088 RepID=A0A383WMU4_TETOB